MPECNKLIIMLGYPHGLFQSQMMHSLLMFFLFVCPHLLIQNILLLKFCWLKFSWGHFSVKLPRQQHAYTPKSLSGTKCIHRIFSMFEQEFYAISMFLLWNPIALTWMNPYSMIVSICLCLCLFDSKLWQMGSDRNFVVSVKSAKSFGQWLGENLERKLVRLTSQINGVHLCVES